MFSLKMVQMNKNFYDPRAGPMVPQHKLEIWLGYVTAVQEFEGGIMLCCDVSHKVLRTQTAYELTPSSTFTDYNEVEKSFFTFARSITTSLSKT